MTRVLSYNTCKNLKSMGFNEPCPAYYLIDKPDDVHQLFSSNFLNQDTPDIRITCPTISQVLDWLWYDKNIHVEVFVNDDRTFGVFTSKFDDNGGRMEDNYSGMYESRTEAEIAAIKMLTQNL